MTDNWQAEAERLRAFCSKQREEIENVNGMADAVEVLRDIGKVFGCGHVDDPDGRRQLTNCIEQEFQRLREENAILSSGVTCFGCGAAYSPDIANGQCDSAHRETWPHEWINQRTRDTIAKCCEHVHEIQRLTTERDDAKACLQIADNRIEDFVATLEVFHEFDGNEDCWAELKEQRDKAVKELAELKAARVPGPPNPPRPKRNIEVA